jgi:methionyl-tRNA formyltransferase
MNRLRIGYFGDGPWSHRALTRLLADETLQIAFVCARHDAPDPVLKRMAGDKGLDFMTHPAVNAADFVDRMRSFRCDLFVSLSFNQIFRRELMSLPPLRTINCHAGKLPFYRGRNVLNWALINDEKEFGITVHYIDEGIDTGDLILQRCYPITDADDYATLLERAYDGCAHVLYDGIKAVQRGDARTTPQSSIHPLGFYCSRRREGDERLDWNRSSREVFNFVRAVCRPGPQALTRLGDSEIRINKVGYLPDVPCHAGIPGAVVGVEPDAFYVKTADSYIRVTEWSGYPKPRIGDRLT